MQIVKSFILSLCIAGAIAGCAGGTFFDQIHTISSDSYSGYIIVAGAGQALTAPGQVSLFDTNGTFVRVLVDYYADLEYPSGVAVFGTAVYSGAEGSADRVDLLDLLGVEDSISFNSSIGASNPIRQMAVDSSGNIYITESNGNTVEKISPEGVRINSPFITGGGSCPLNSPYGVAYIPTTNQIVVTNHTAAAATRLSFYNATTGLCVSGVNNAIYQAQSPAGIAYHPQTNKILFTRVGDESVYTANADGSSPTLAFLQTSVLTDPYSIAVDSDGYVYISANGRDVIEKFSFNGTTLTQIPGPLIGPNVYTQNPTQITVIP